MILLKSYCRSKKKNKKEIELVCEGSLNATSQLVRQGAVVSGGLVTVLRNPVKGKYLKENAAVGGIKMAIEIGEIFENNIGNIENLIYELKKFYSLEILFKGNVSTYNLVTDGGFDVGKVIVENNNNICEICFWNEYMSAEVNGNRVATFPDLIVTLDANSGKVLNSSDIKKSLFIVVVKVSREKLKLGKGMFDKELYKEIEKIINKDLIKYIF